MIKSKLTTKRIKIRKIKSVILLIFHYKDDLFVGNMNCNFID